MRGPSEPPCGAAAALHRPADLPGLVVLTDRRLCRGRPLGRVVAAAVAGGARWVVLREKDLGTGPRRALAEELAAVLAGVGGRLSIAGVTDLEAPADRDHGGLAGLHVGCHLASRDSWPAGPTGQALVGRSCHSPDELGRASQDGCHYAFLSPVFETASKPGYGPALGPRTLARWCASASLPVYALGGIHEGRARVCIDAGAAGVAVMGAVMGADDPGEATAGLLDEVGSARLGAPSTGVGTGAGTGRRGTIGEVGT